MRATVLTVMSGLLISCASVQKQPAKYQEGSFPALGVRTSVNVGQVMASRYDYLANVTATLREGVPGGFWSGRRGLVAGDSLVAAVSQGEQVFCQPPGSMGSPCLQDTDGDGRFDRAATFNAYGMLVNHADIPPAEYRISSQAILDGFKFELLYQGLDNGVVRIAYREFTDNLARPAFAQDLTYTLASTGDTQASFRDVSLLIHSADNTRVEYTVTSGFGEVQRNRGQCALIGAASRFRARGEAEQGSVGPRSGATGQSELPSSCEVVKQGLE